MTKISKEAREAAEKLAGKYGSYGVNQDIVEKIIQKAIDRALSSVKEAPQPPSGAKMLWDEVVAEDSASREAPTTQEQQREETGLAPCPFCGSANVGVPFEDTSEGHVNRWITCYECSCDGPTAFKVPEKEAEQQARAQWNQRVPQIQNANHNAVGSSVFNEVADPEKDAKRLAEKIWQKTIKSSATDSGSGVAEDRICHSVGNPICPTCGEQSIPSLSAPTDEEVKED